MYFKHARIDLTTKSVIAVKPENHFRAAFAPIASEVICVDALAGLISSDFK
jgi:microcystin degradation protein MlrC